jgi:hypothetical protein
MNVYRIDIWRSVNHGETFSHNVQRVEIVHALNKDKALKKIKLAPEKVWHSGSLEIKASSETIYSIEKTGTVTIQPFYVYSDGRTPRPVSLR